MALSLRHWVLGGVLACAAIAVAKLPPPVEPSRPAYAFRLEDFEVPLDRVELLRAALRIRRGRLDRAQDVAQLVRTVRETTPRSDGVPLLVTTLPLAGRTRRVIEERVASLWKDLGPTSPDVTVGVVLAEHGPQLQILPSASGGRTCIVKLPLDWSLRWMLRSSEPPRADQVDPWLRQGIGACAFYAAFGRPGPAVERWLLGRGFDLGGDADWTGAAQGRWYRFGALPAGVRLARALIAWELDERYSASLDAVACNAGDLPRCRAALFLPDTTAIGRRRRREPPGVVLGWSWWDTRGGLYGGRVYLADLVRTTGRERFGVFWRSPAPVDSAFQTAMGLSIEAWTARWQRERMGVLTVGSRIRAASILLGLLVAGLFVAGSAYFAGRRQIG